MYLVSALLDRVAKQYDVSGFDARHTPADMLLLASAALMRVLEGLGANRCFDKVTMGTPTSAAGATSGRCGTIVAPSDTVSAKSILSVDVLIGTIWQELPVVSPEEESTYNPTRTGSPECWCHVTQDGVVVPTADATTLGTARLMLLPATDTTYSLRVRYVPDVTLLTTDKLALDILEIDWMVAELGVYLAQRDEETTPGVLQMREAQRAAAEGKALKAARTRNAVFGKTTREVRENQNLLWLRKVYG